jgi:hypothetical protein
MGLVYMGAAVVFPDVPATGDVDLAEHWDRHRTAFFAFLLAMLAASLLKSIALDDRLPRTGDLIFHLVLAGVAIVGIAVRGAPVQLLLACVTAALLVAYVGLLFARI